MEPFIRRGAASFIGRCPCRHRKTPHRATLAEATNRATDPALRLDLIQRWALAAFAANETKLGEQLYGKALVAGGTDAYQVLGMRALRNGELDRARRLFRALMLDRSAAEEGFVATPWALRGWGVSLLPER